MTIERPFFPLRAESVDAWRAFKCVCLSERELTPKDVLTDLFTEELHPDPEWMTEMVIKRLQDAGFKIVADDA